MKIKTFKKGEDAKINKFLEGVRPIQGGITIGEDTVTIQYFDGLYQEFTKEDMISEYHKQISSFKLKKFNDERELEWRAISGESNSPSERIRIEKDIEHYTEWIARCEELIKELA